MIHKAFQGNPDLKLSCIHGMKQLIKAKKLTQDRTWDVNAYVSAVQTDQPLAELIRALFIQLPEEEAFDWATAHLEAIPVNADLSKVWTNFIEWLLTDENQGMKQIADQPEINQIYNDLLVYIQFPDQEKGRLLNLQCEEYIHHLNVENDPTNKYLYLCTIAKSILNKFSYQLIESLQQLQDALMLNPEEVKQKLQATHEVTDAFHDFEPGEFERMFKEVFHPVNHHQTVTGELISISLAKRLLHFLNTAPVS